MGKIVIGLPVWFFIVVNVHHQLVAACRYWSARVLARGCEIPVGFCDLAPLV